MSLVDFIVGRTIRIWSLELQQASQYMKWKPISLLIFQIAWYAAVCYIWDARNLLIHVAGFNFDGKSIFAKIHTDVLYRLTDVKGDRSQFAAC